MRKGQCRQRENLRLGFEAGCIIGVFKKEVGEQGIIGTTRKAKVLRSSRALDDFGFTPNKTEGLGQSSGDGGVDQMAAVGVERRDQTPDTL